MLRRHDADHDFSAVQSFLQTAGGQDRCRYGLTGKEQFVHATGRDRIANFFLVRPEPDLMMAAASHHDGETRTPRARADNRDPAHPRLH